MQRRMLTMLAALVLTCIPSSGCTESQVATATPATAPTPISRLASIPEDAHKVTPAEDAYPPILHSEAWHDPVPLDGPINTAGAEDSPFIAADGRVFLFFFTPDVRVPVEKQLLDGVTGIYASTFEQGAWTEPVRVRLQDPGKLALDGCGFFLDDVLWFCTAREGLTGLHWFTADFRNGKWSDWQISDFDPAYEVGELHIHEEDLYFHSQRAGGVGGTDIWVSRRADGEWLQPQNVTAVNSPENEGMPYVTADGAELWFNRWYLGSPAVFRSRRVEGEWMPAELIISQFAGEPTLDPEGNIYFVHHYYQDGTMIEADIYVAYRNAGK